MKKVLLILMMAYSASAFAQGACDTKIDAKSYTVKFVVTRVGDQGQNAQPGVEHTFSYLIEIHNKTKVKLEFVPGLWGTAPHVSTVKSLGDGNKKTAGPGSQITISGTFKAETLQEMKLKVNNVDCTVSGKKTFVDPTFYKATK